MFDGRRLRIARERVSMTVPEVAEAAGISKAYLYQMENGDVASPSAEVVYKICRTIGTHMGYILCLADEDRDLTSDVMMRTIRENAELKRIVKSIKGILDD
jgi:transcriptional regulator with XRE-family HTH domain